MGRKNISINDETHERLKKHGRYGDSFDSILNRLMDLAEDRTGKHEYSPFTLDEGGKPTKTKKISEK
jgi:hypothetical protein